jgi:hypothetical protein
LHLTTDQKRAVFERLLARNEIRREMGMRPLNILEAYQRKVAAMKTQEYEARLEPYLIAVFASVDWPEGFTPRLLLSVKLHKKAIAQLYRDHGVVDPRTKTPDIIAIIDKFAPSPDNDIGFGNQKMG